uniref:1,4-alpha-glucan branching enzyme n=1 Tax=Eubacterium cellulosolvens (strain ATCC 43171 / JCM 9499 / 6) TaxID=633697 RepID=I5AVE3_EUBC6
MGTTETMESMIYDLMDWAEIEAVVYAEESTPRKILGPQIVDGGILVQAFYPDEDTVSVRLEDGTVLPMVQEDEAGFFAVLLSGRKVPDYTYIVGSGKEAKEEKDPYAYPCQITEKEEVKFTSGIWRNAYEKMGSHLMEINGCKGAYFALWAPDAVRVSVVGDFNDWDGRRYPMNRLDSGIYELFIPGVEAGCFYKYEIKSRAGMVYLKADPYANESQQMPEAASVVASLDYKWGDEKWMKERESRSVSGTPVAVYEVDLSAWAEEEATYREIAPKLASHAAALGYTDVELLPVMEYPEDETKGFGTSGFFAPTSRYGTAKDFMYLVDTIHKAGLGVILDWNPGSFARGNDGLSSFDGTCLYEHLDPKKGVHPGTDQLIFNYGRKEVVSFLKASAACWLNLFHADGLKVSDLASTLYLNYGRRDGEWIANMYGSNENLEALDFFRGLNREIHQQNPGVMMIAEEQTGFPMVTGDPDKEGLGFDLKWNNGCIDDYMRYIQLDPLFRGSHQEELTFSMVYNYSEKFMLSLSHQLTENGARSFLKQMPGGKAALKAANLRLTYAYLLAHPGKKLLTWGQDGGEMTTYVRDLLALYKSERALHELDDAADGFEWISNLDWKRNLLVFLRKGSSLKDTLLVVANFSNLEYDNFLVGVPYPGKYKEIFNSDAEEYGGTGAVNPRVKLSRAVEQDERQDSIKIRIAPLAVSIYKFTEPIERVELTPARRRAALRKNGIVSRASGSVKPAEKKKATKAEAVKKVKEEAGKKVEAVKKAVKAETEKKAATVRKTVAEKVKKNTSGKSTTAAKKK